jgi:excisionase family DNA binding protein
VTTREAANLLDASVRTIQIWVEQGQLKAWKTPGGHRRILRSSVNEVLAKRVMECSDQPGNQVRLDATGEDLAMLNTLVRRGYAPNPAGAYRRALCEAHSRLGEAASK